MMNVKTQRRGEKKLCASAVKLFLNADSCCPKQHLKQSQNFFPNKNNYLFIMTYLGVAKNNWSIPEAKTKKNVVQDVHKSGNQNRKIIKKYNNFVLLRSYQPY
jgi:hypothetical protein